MDLSSEKHIDVGNNSSDDCSNNHKDDVMYTNEKIVRKTIAVMVLIVFFKLVSFVDWYVRLEIVEKKEAAVHVKDFFGLDWED